MDLLNIIPTALLTVTDNVGHYEAFKKNDKYIVWAEEGQANSVWSDNQMQNQAIQGTIDYFTKMEDDPNFDKIQNALSDAMVSFRLNSVQYEDDTKYIHYEWTWEIWRR